MLRSLFHIQNPWGSLVGHLWVPLGHMLQKKLRIILKRHVLLPKSCQTSCAALEKLLNLGLYLRVGVKALDDISVSQI